MKKAVFFFLPHFLFLFSCGSEKREVSFNGGEAPATFKIAPLSQRFVIDARQDTVLAGRHGAMFWLPANALVDKLGRPATRAIVMLTEINRAGQMFLLDLPTMAGEKPLSTGGMFDLRAETPEGKPLLLASGKQVTFAVTAILSSHALGQPALFGWQSGQAAGAGWGEPAPLEKGLLTLPLAGLTFGWQNECDCLSEFAPLKAGQYENTIVATKEFVERSKVISFVCRIINDCRRVRRLVAIYAENAHLPIHMADSLALDYLLNDMPKGFHPDMGHWLERFERFAGQRLGESATSGIDCDGANQPREKSISAVEANKILAYCKLKAAIAARIRDEKDYGVKQERLEGGALSGNAFLKLGQIGVLGLYNIDSFLDSLELREFSVPILAEAVLPTITDERHMVYLRSLNCLLRAEIVKKGDEMVLNCEDMPVGLDSACLLSAYYQRDTRKIFFAQKVFSIKSGTPVRLNYTLTKAGDIMGPD